jgi:adenine-specific DNA-methyltransferase
MAAKKRAPKIKVTQVYQHPEAELLMRPEVGTQAQFKKKKPPQKYRYDSSLSPSLEWDGQNPAREAGEALIRQITEAGLRLAELAKKPASQERDKEIARLQSTVREAEARLKKISGAFLNWTGKAERLSFDVPTLPLFIHERLSTKAIIETLKGHQTDKQEYFFRELYGDPQHSVTDQVLKAYEYRDDWVNRMMLGDSLVVMNSLLRYESLGGQVQMIYIDPPYGVRFGSNFQPFVRKREVSHNDDADMTREPEMVQAYRDTWELGLHSYLTYLRDRLLLARELLHPSGSIFVQISTENLHYVTMLLGEVFGPENKIEVISFRKKTMPLGGTLLEGSCDYLVWYAKDKERVKYRPVFKRSIIEGDSHWNWVELPNATRRPMTPDEIDNHRLLPEGADVYQLIGMYPTGSFATGIYDFEFDGTTYRLPPGKCWKTPIEGMQRLAKAKRLQPYASGSTLRYILKFSDYPVSPLDNVWADTSAPSDKTYVVQTSSLVVQRCLLMTTDPGDLVLDPTCGSGTTAYVAEQWGRRWITIDTSRVPLALARQRLLTATFPYYELKGEERGPAGGFVYKRKQNQKGEEVGGIVPHITLKSIANNEPPAEEVLVDRPEVKSGIVRVTGPFTLEATIPTPVDWEGDGKEDSGAISQEAYGSFVDRMIEVLRKSPVLRVEGNRTVQLKNIRPPAKTLSLSGEAIVANGQDRPVAIVFGPENGAVSEKLVYEAAREAHAKNYTHLYVIGFAIQPNARALVEKCNEVMGVSGTYVQATPDLMMGDLLKNMRSSQIFSVCGLPEVKLSKVKDPKVKTSYAVRGNKQYQVELLGLDVFDPISMEVNHQSGNDVPAWFLDTNYNGLCFHVSQAFFPRTGVWENLKKALRGDYEETVWDHLAGTVSAPFPPGEHGQIAVKVIDQRGNELLVVKSLKETER